MDKEQLKDLLKKWQKQFSCGGHISDGSLTLQGDYKSEVQALLLKMSYRTDQIVVAGTGK